MKKITITYFALLSFSFSFAQQTLILQPVADASIGFHDGYNSADNNYGSAIYYGAFSQPGTNFGENAGMSLMQFDLSQIAPGTEISSASLDLYGSGPFGTGDAAEIGHTGKNAALLERITSQWNENTVTYNTQPTATHRHRVKLTQSNSVDQNYIGIDVTDLVQSMINDPAHSFGFRIRLRNEEPTRAMSFVSTDGNNAAKFPTLTITIGSEKVLSEIAQDKERIYPNPFSNTATIDLSGLANAGELTIKIYNMQGGLANTLNIPYSETIQIEKGNLQNGIYLFMIFNQGNLILSKKMVVQ